MFREWLKKSEKLFKRFVKDQDIKHKGIFRIKISEHQDGMEVSYHVEGGFLNWITFPPKAFEDYEGWLKDYRERQKKAMDKIGKFLGFEEE